MLRRMGLRAIYQKPRTTLPGNPSERFSCLVDVNTLRSMNQAWATNIPLEIGFLYPVAIMDLFSRNVFSWKLPTSLDTEFCRMRWSGAERPRSSTPAKGCKFLFSDFVVRL